MNTINRVVRLSVILAAMCGITAEGTEGVYVVKILDRGHRLSDSELSRAFDPNGQLSKKGNVVSAAKSILQRAGLFFAEENTTYTLCRAAIANALQWIAVVEITEHEYREYGPSSMPMREMMKARDSIYYNNQGKIKIAAFHEDGRTNYSGGVFKVPYQGEPFWLYGTMKHVEYLGAKYGMTNEYVSASRIVLSKGDEMRRAEMVFELQSNAVTSVMCSINGVLLWDLVIAGIAPVEGCSLPLTATMKTYIGGAGLQPSVVRETIVEFIPHETYVGSPSPEEFMLAVDRDVEGVDYRSGRSIDVFIAPDGTVRPYHRVSAQN